MRKSSNVFSEKMKWDEETKKCQEYGVHLHSFLVVADLLHQATFGVKAHYNKKADAGRMVRSDSDILVSSCRHQKRPKSHHKTPRRNEIVLLVV